MIDINWNPPRRQLRLFGGLWLPLFLVALGTLWLWRHGAAWLPFASGLWIGAVAIAAVGWFAPQLIRPVFVGMLLITFPIGWLVSHLILAFIFYCVMTPLGLLMRLVGRDPMHRRFDRNAATYWTPFRPPPDKSRYFRQY